VNRFTTRSVLLLLILLASLSTFAQGWPTPAKTPNTEVTCASSLCLGAKTVGYAAPLTTFVGRFLDSQATRDYQQNFRTLRAKKIALSQDGKRIYVIMGSLLAAYDTNTFFSRLTGGESMVGSNSVPLSVPNLRSGNPAPEMFLKPDRYFYAEHGSTWVTPFVDGQDRLNNMDSDDEGYLYLTHYAFSWGIVRDTGGSDFSSLPTLFQKYPPSDNEGDPVQVMVLRNSNGQYYAFVNVTYSTQIWDVTNRANPQSTGRTLPFKLDSYARNSVGDRVALNDATGAVRIYTADSLMAGGLPLATIPPPAAGWQWTQLTSDGTNFYASGMTQAGLQVAVIKPSGQTYVLNNGTPFATGINATPNSLKASPGYLMLTLINKDVLLYQVDANGNFTRLRFPSTASSTDYFLQYYGQPPAGYAQPSGSYVQMTDGLILKNGGKTYLIVLAFGLADVYELQSAGGINVTQNAPAGTANPNTPAVERTKLVYGDPVAFTATTTAAAPIAVTWNFGNPEAVAGADPNLASGTTGVIPVLHRYSGIGSAAGLTSRTVTATNSTDSTVAGTTAVVMQAPTARIGVSGSTTLFTQSNTSGTLGLVVGDKWLDASDGTLESHTSVWGLYNAATATGTPVTSTFTPDKLVDAGTCGPHFMSFAAHYGQNGMALPATDYTAPVGGMGISYTVRPFAAAASVTSTPSSTTVTFTNATRLSSDATLLTSALTAALTYKWEVVNPDGTSATSIPTATGLLSAIQPYVVAKSLLTQRGMKGRLTITSPTAFTGACANMASSVYDSGPLNVPDPVITGDCTAGGPPCSFAAGSSTVNLDQTADHWAYSWSISPATYSAANNTNKTFTPLFTAVGTYTVTLDVTNDFGTARATKQISVTSAPTCPAIVANSNVFIVFSGATSNCTIAGSTLCSYNETITFNVSTFGGYDLGCSPHKVVWDFGDGTPAVTILSASTPLATTVTHSYTSGTSYNVTATVTNSSGTPAVLTQSVILGVVSTPPTPPSNPPNPPPTTPPSGGSCGEMVAGSNVYFAFGQNSGACSTSGGNCNVGEDVIFTATAGFGYNFACGDHTYLWNFGDGTGGGSGATVRHSFTANSTYNVSLTVIQAAASGGRQVTYTQPVKVGGTTTPGVCGTMVPNSNVFVNFINGANTCTQNGGTCATNDVLTFNAVTGSTYDLSCATHTYDWDFGDGSAHGSGRTPQHTYATAKTYTVTLKITNTVNNATATVTQPVTITGGGTGNCPAVKPGDNVFVIYHGAATNCSQVPNSGNCGTNEDVSFNVGFGFGYSPTCGTHTYDWDFGDGSGHSNAITPTHRYTQERSYTVTLNVTVNGSTTTPVTQTIVVGAGPQAKPDAVADFTILPLAASNGTAIPNAYTFRPTVTPEGAITTWNWDFGDGQKGSGSGDVTHVYSGSQNYKVTLTATDWNNHQVTVIHTVIPARRRAAGH
jgi:PKD repeat protein